jgi:hypothetical protein
VCTSKKKDTRDFPEKKSYIKKHIKKKQKQEEGEAEG